MKAAGPAPAAFLRAGRSGGVVRKRPGYGRFLARSSAAGIVSLVPLLAGRTERPNFVQ
jgi:hypothetical protein